MSQPRRRGGASKVNAIHGQQIIKWIRRHRAVLAVLLYLATFTLLLGGGPTVIVVPVVITLL